MIFHTREFQQVETDSLSLTEKDSVILILALLLAYNAQFIN